MNVKNKPKTQTTKIYGIMFVKLSNQNKLRCKHINKNLTSNNEWRYLAIRD